MSNCELGKISSLDRALMGECIYLNRLWIKHQRMATRTQIHKSHQRAQQHTHTLIYKHSSRIKPETVHAQNKDSPIGRTSHAEKDLNITENGATLIASLPIQQS